MELDKSAREKTAFVAYGSFWESKTMPFGHCNAPATFQRFMESVLKHLNYKIALCYLDDIIVHSKTFDDHLDHLKQVFARAREANIKLKPSKCHFGYKQVDWVT